MIVRYLVGRASQPLPSRSGGSCKTGFIRYQRGKAGQLWEAGCL